MGSESEPFACEKFSAKLQIDYVKMHSPMSISFFCCSLLCNLVGWMYPNRPQKIFTNFVMFMIVRMHIYAGPVGIEVPTVMGHVISRSESKAPVIFKMGIFHVGMIERRMDIVLFAFDSKAKAAFMGLPQKNVGCDEKIPAVDSFGTSAGVDHAACPLFLFKSAEAIFHIAHLRTVAISIDVTCHCGK